MADIATIAAALGSLKTATDIAKLIKNSGASLEQAEVKLQIAELISALAEAKIEIADIQSALMEKDRIISSLSEKLTIKQNIVWDSPYYWLVNEADRDGPYCQRCYDVEQRLVRLQGSGKSGWGCRSCKSSFYDAQYVPPVIRF